MTASSETGERMATRPTLPARLPSIADAPLPATYTQAKAALAACDRLDECADWADKAAAMASYAKQADDKTLFNMAVRIQARASRRCGELLRAIQRPEQGGRPEKNGAAGGPVSRAQAAREAGLSDRERKTALRVAAIPEAAFEAAVEAETPPTVTQLAKQGTRPAPKPLFDLKGRDPAEFQASTRAQGAMRLLAEVAATVPPEVAVRGAMPGEYALILSHLAIVRPWLDTLYAEVLRAQRRST